MRFDVFFAENTDKEVTEKEVKKLLASKNPQFAYESAFIGRDNYKQFKDLYEAKILESPYWTYKYVADVLNYIRGDTSRPHNRWPKGESVIAKDAYASWLYARYIIYGRWLEGEKAIFDSEDPQYKDLYLDFLKNIGYQDEDNEEQQDDVITRDLITNRFLGKEIVSLDDSIDYAEEQGKRWPKLEQYILYTHFPGHGIDYAKRIIKGRWIELENFIQKYYGEDSIYRKNYLEMLKGLGYEDEDNEEQNDVIRRALFTYVDNITGKQDIDDTTSLKYAIRQGKRWPKLEQHILNSYLGLGGITYAEKVIKGRWIEYEEYLNKYWKEAMPEYQDMLKRIGYEDEDNEELSFESFYDDFTPKTPNDVLEIAKDFGERLPEYEHIILNSNDPNAPTIAYEYLKKIINKNAAADQDRVPWPEAEPLLAKDGDVAFRYALYFINADKWDDEAYNDLPLTRFPLGEPEIAKDAYTASRYAINVIKGRWPEGEQAIFKDNYEKKEYIKFLNDIGYQDEDNEEQDDVITIPLIYDGTGDVDIEACLVHAERRNKRWPELEKIILNSREFHLAIIYAQLVIKGRWLELENKLNNPSFSSSFFKERYEKMLKEIGYEDEDNEELSFESFFSEAKKKVRPPSQDELEDPLSASIYAYYVLHGRWKEKEQLIAYNSQAAFQYAKYTLKDRWINISDIDKNIAEIAEYNIMISPSICVIYARDVIKDRWPELEKYIIENSKVYVAVNYVENVLKRRWPEAEPFIMKDPSYKEDYIELLNNIGYEDEDNEEKDENVINKSLFLVPGTNGVMVVDDYTCLDYARKQGKRWPEFEKYIIESRKLVTGVKYTKDVIKGRWPALEPLLKPLPYLQDIYIRNLNQIGYEDEDNEELSFESFFTEAKKKVRPPTKDELEDPFQAFQYAYNVLKDRFPPGEKAILEDPDKYQIANYAQNVIKERWPEGEKEVVKNPIAAYWYARDVIEGEWPEAEPYIMKDAGAAYHYASVLLKRRWIEAEDIIKQNPWSAYSYAKEVIQDRWPEAEPFIMKDPESVIYYADKVIKGRWPEAEDIIKQDPHKWSRYLENLEEAGYQDEDNEELSFESFFTETKKKVRPPTQEELTLPNKAYFYARDVLQGRFPEGEKAILDDPSLNWTINYVVDIVKSRWPEAEPAIFNDPDITDMYMQFLNDIGYQDEDNEELSFESFFSEAKSKETQPSRPPTQQELTKPRKAYVYARKILKGRWPEMEPLIATDPESAYLYARYVIKGRWPEAEPTIVKDSYSACWYAIKVIKGRWPEAEPTIAKNATSSIWYATDVLKGRFLLGEPEIAKTAENAIWYTMTVIKSRWHEGEEAILNSKYKNHYLNMLGETGYQDEDNEEL